MSNSYSKGSRSRSAYKNAVNHTRQALRSAAVIEPLERRAYMAVQVSFGNGIIDQPEESVQPVDFTIGQFNGGSTPDLAVHYHWPGQTDIYAVRLGQGNGSFQLEGQLNDFYPSEGRLATGDFNGDGLVDLFTSFGNLNLFQAPTSDTSDGTGVVGWRGDGRGNLFDAQRGGGSDGDSARLYRARNSIRNYSTADMTGDAKTDVITVGAEGLVVWQTTPPNGAANYRFSGAILDPSPTYVTVNAIDVNGDGRRDIITTNQTSPGFMITVWVKNSNGGYSAKTSSRLSATPSKLRMADFNKDGKLDAAILEGSSSGSYVDICFGNGDGTFNAPARYALNATVNDFTVGDFDIDGRVDVAFTLPSIPGLGLSKGFGLLRNRGDGSMQRIDSPKPDRGTDLIDSTDFNNDGKPDLIVRYADTKQLAVLLNTAVKQNVIRGTVFNDLNQDQVRQSNEPGLANRRVYVDVNDDGVYDANEATTTLADGTWELRVPNGTYRIRQELPPRWAQTVPYGVSTKPTARDVTISGIHLSSGNDFGAYDQGNITGFVYNDSNANRIRDPFEGGRSGVSVYFDTNGNKLLDLGEQSVVTDASGRYSFNAGNGFYTVRAVVQTAAGWQSTGTASYKAKVLSSSSFNSGLDFGQTQPATISGHVYYDFAANARQDAGDVGVGGLQLFLDLDNDGVLDAGEASTTSSNSTDPALKGGYKFTGLYPNTYSVRLVKPQGYQQLAPSIAGEGRGGPFRTFAYGGADTTYTDFGVIRPINVSGRAYGDTNANGNVDVGETGLSSLTVFIDYNGNGLADLDEPQKLTDANGNYMLTSTREGTLNVRALRRSGLSSTVPSSSLYAVRFTYGAAETTGRNFGLTVGAFSTAPYQSPINIDTGSNPTALAAGDFDGDGKQDFIVASNSSSSRVYLGQGNGLFTSGQQFSIGDSTRYMIAVDVSGDGKPDLVAANEALDFGASVFIGNGDGTFKTPKQYAVTTNTYGVAAADFNSDGKRDLAYVGTTDGRVAILINKGDGSFKDATFVTNTFGGKSIFAGDVNRDKFADLVVANPGSNAVSVLLGNGKGSFTKTAADVTGGINQPNFVTLADFNKDGKLDLITINEFSDEVRVKLGDGKGAFADGQAYATASTPTQVAVLDIDRDGKLDLIVSCRSDGTTDISGGVSILRGRGDGTFVDQRVRTAHTSPTAVAIADYNGDRKLDIVTANFFSDDVSLLFNGTPVAGGSIKGIVFNDRDSSGDQNAGENGLAGQTVYADLNNNGVYDAGERFARTDSSGSYTLLDLTPGTYRVRTVLPNSQAQTSPVNRAAQVVQLADGRAVTDKNFGETPILINGSYVFDDKGAQISGNWTHATTTGQYAGGFLSDGNTGRGTKSVRFDAKLPGAGYYSVQSWWVAGSDRATNAPIDIQTATNKLSFKLDEQDGGPGWITFGTYYFNPTKGSVTFRTNNANGLVVADAVRFVPVAAPPTIVKDNSDPNGIKVIGTWAAAKTPTGFNGIDYYQDGNPRTKGGRSIRYTPTLPDGGSYEIFARWTAGGDHASHARYDIVTTRGTSTVTANQRTRGGVWVSLGFFDLNPATASVTILNDGANGRVNADGIRFVRVV